MLSDYIIDELTTYIVNDSTFTVVERRNLEVLQKELDFQMSGEVSDETALSIGKKLGAQSIISGSVEPLGDIYRLHIQATAVETAQIQGMQNILIVPDAVLSALLGRKRSLSAGHTASGTADDSWKFRRLSVGLRPGMALHFYDTKDGTHDGFEAKMSASIDFAAQFAVHFNQFFALQTELTVTSDSMNVVASENVTDEFGHFQYAYDAVYSYTSRSLLIPVFAKVTHRPGIFSLAGLAGVYFSVPVGSAEYTNSYTGESISGNIIVPMGFAAGGSVGLKLGPGILFADARYMLDFGKTQFSDSESTVDIYKRSMASFGLGYEIGFINY
jgi:hypothetical protein